MKRTEEAQWRAGGVNGDGGDAVIAEKKTYANGKTGKCQDSLRGTKGWCHSKELKNSSPHRRWGRKRGFRPEKEKTQIPDVPVDDL